MSKSITNTLKLTAAAASLAVLACASTGALEEVRTTAQEAKADAAQANSTANRALNTANQAQRDAQAAMQMAQENRQAMDRMFERNMRK
jgi:predicted nicotinamide N-methyase